MINLNTPQRVVEPEKLIGVIHRYQITGFSFVDDLRGSYVQVVVTGYNVDGETLTPVKTIPVTILASTLAENPVFLSLHDQARDALESYLIREGVIQNA